MNKGLAIALIVACFCLISSSIGGALYWFRCDLDLGDCPAPVGGCTDPLADNTNTNATQDDGTCTYTYDNPGKVMETNSNPWSWGDYTTVAMNDGTFSPYITDGSFKKFNTWKECRQYIAEKKPDANIAIYRNTSHANANLHNTCGYVKVDSYSNSDPFRFRDYDHVHYLCTKPGVKLDNSCI